MDADQQLELLATQLDVPLDTDPKPAAHASVVVMDGSQLYLSGHIPRVGDQVLVTGTVGADVSVAQGQLAAKVAMLRALGMVRRQLGSLERVLRVPRLTVYVQAAYGFTQLAEVADGASSTLRGVLGEAGRHTLTTIGVVQLPHNAAVALDLIASCAHAPLDDMGYTPTTASLQFARSMPRS